VDGPVKAPIWLLESNASSAHQIRACGAMHDLGVHPRERAAVRGGPARYNDAGLRRWSCD
jgi:hypothetical protein